jgi:general secretion pathway protein G
VITNDSSFRVFGDKGYTFLELVIVIVIISVIVAVGLNKYRELLVVVERTSMDRELGIIRSAIGMQVAEHFLAGNMEGLQLLVNSNPMDLLAEKPKSYIGNISHLEPTEIEDGVWYFDADINAMIYKVIHWRSFESELKPARARFKIMPVYSDKKAGIKTTRYLSGLSLTPLEPYRWRKSSD